jgi:uncharacterized lipoprotein
MAALLSACSGIEQKRLEYRNSQSIAPLKLPPGLQEPQSPTMLPLPEVDTAAAVVDVAPPVNLPEELLAEPETAAAARSENSAPDDE